MFTGIIQTLGEVVRCESNRLTLRTARSGLKAGSSIAVNGVCLTVVTARGLTKNRLYTFDLSQETVARTSLGLLKANERVNLEGALRLGDELGGHIVQGHVDGVGQLVSRAAQDNSVLYEFSFPSQLGRYLAAKGSIAVDGISLTIAERREGTFTAAIIPFTDQHTNLGAKKIGEPVNLEVDILAKHVEKLLEAWREDNEAAAVKKTSLWER